jgi:hypothetical protein
LTVKLVYVCAHHQLIACARVTEASEMYAPRHELQKRALKPSDLTTTVESRTRVYSEYRSWQATEKQRALTERQRVYEIKKKTPWPESASELAHRASAACRQNSANFCE